MKHARIVLAAIAIVSSCGYTVIGGEPPYGLAELTVVPFAEDVPAGIAPELARELSTLLSADGVTVTSHADHAVGVLSGTILSARSHPYPVTQGAGIPAYQMNVRIRAQLRSSAGETLWGTTVGLTEDFLASGTRGSTSALQTEANRRRALVRLAQRAAQQIHTELMLASATRAP